MCSHEKVKQINNLKFIIKKYFRFHLDKENFILVKDKTPKMVSKKREMTSADLAKAKSFLRANDIKGHDKFMAQFE